MYWVNQAYGHLRLGSRIYTSNCDFLCLKESMPRYWRLALTILGSIEGPYPRTTLRESLRAAKESETPFQRNMGNPTRTWTPSELAMEPLNFNPQISGDWGEANVECHSWEESMRDKSGTLRLKLCSPACKHCDPNNRKPIKSHCRLSHFSTDRKEVAEERLRWGETLAEHNITHLGHLLTGTNPGEELRLKHWDEVSSSWSRAAAMPFKDKYYRLTSGFPRSWQQSLDKFGAQMRNLNMTYRELAQSGPKPQGTWLRDELNHIIVQVGPEGKGNGPGYQSDLSQTLKHSNVHFDTSIGETEVAD